MSQRFILIHVVLLVAACGSRTEPATNPAADVAPAQPATGKGEAPPISAPSGLFACKAKTDAPPAAADKTDVWAIPYEVQGCPSIPSPLGAVRFGMTRDEVAAVIGQNDGVVADVGRDPTQPASDSVAIHLGEPPHTLALSIRFSKAGKVDKLSHKLDAKGFARLESVWGAPFAFNNRVYTTYRWFNPETGLRVSAEPTTWKRRNAANEDEEVEGHELHFEPYMPLAKALGPDGLLHKDLIGKNVTEVTRIFPDAVGAPGTRRDLHLPTTELEASSLYVILNWADDKVEDYSMVLDYYADNEDKPLKTEILAVVASVLGQPTAGPDRFGAYTFAGPNGQVIWLAPTPDDSAWVLKVSKP